MRKEPFERVACRRVLKEIFKSDTEEVKNYNNLNFFIIYKFYQVLRDKLLELS